MLKKFAIAAAPLALAFGTPSLAADKPDAEEMHDHGMVDDGPYSPGMNALNPFAGMEEFALKKPIINLPKPDPARLVIAEQIANALYADGTSARIFTTMRTELFEPVLNRFWTMKASEGAELFGFEGDMPKSKKDETLGEAMSKDDPHAKERLEAFAKVYLDMLGSMTGAIESDLRGAMSRDFARRYDVAQLTDMANFFATPTGAILARDYWINSMTLDTIQTSMMVWPKMMKAVPDFAERMKKADAHLPPAPNGGFFGPGEDDYLPECAKDGDESDCTAADWEAYGVADAAAMDVANAASDAAMAAGAAAAGVGNVVDGDTGNEPWYLEENWAATDKTKFDTANSAYRDHEIAADDLYRDIMDAEEAAIKAARDKYKKQGWKPAPVKE